MHIMTHMKVPCHTCECGISRINHSRHTCVRVMSHATHMDGSSHTYGCVMSRMDELCHISLARAGSLSNAIFAPSSPLLISCDLSLPISHSFCLPALVVSRSLPHFSFPSPSPRLFTLDLAHLLAFSLSLSPLRTLALPHLPSLPCINRGCCMIVAPLRSSVTPCIETACA